MHKIFSLLILTSASLLGADRLIICEMAAAFDAADQLVVLRSRIEEDCVQNFKQLDTECFQDMLQANNHAMFWEGVELFGGADEQNFEKLDKGCFQDMPQANNGLTFWQVVGFFNHADAHCNNAQADALVDWLVANLPQQVIERGAECGISLPGGKVLYTLQPLPYALQLKLSSAAVPQC